MSEVLVALGSNLGDSLRILEEAMDDLEGLSAGGFRRSSFWRTPPMDCPPGSPWFVNAAVAFESEEGGTPEAWLGRLQAMETRFGRRPKQVLNEPRPLDLDLIAFGAEERASATLVLPHPRAHLRRFVLAPLAEVSPGFILPGQGKTLVDLLAGLVSDEVVTRIEEAGGGQRRGRSFRG